MSYFLLISTIIDGIVRFYTYHFGDPDVGMSITFGNQYYHIRSEFWDDLLFVTVYHNDFGCHDVYTEYH